MLEEKLAEYEGMDPWIRLSKDLREASKMMGALEARWLVDSYYDTQKLRVATGNRISSNEKKEPTSMLGWVHHNMEILERDMKTALGVFARSYTMGRWLQGICGIGPVLSANILATFNVRGIPYVTKWWRFAGLDPTLRWIKREEAKELIQEIVGDRKKVTYEDIAKCGERTNRRAEVIMQAHTFLKTPKKKKKEGEPETPPKPPRPLTTPKDLEDALIVRPWNGRAKKICYFMGDQIMKQQNRETGEFYGRMYVERKAREIELNNQYAFKELAAIRATQVGKGSEAYQWYKQGLLSPGHIDMRARRFAVKILLSHIHGKFYEDYYGEPAPVPYVLSEDGEGKPRIQGHTHFLNPPTHEVKPGKSLRDLYK